MPCGEILTAVVLDRTHWMLYFLSAAMRPRFLITLDESLQPLPVSVRVGKAVDVVGQAGKPRTISGFQTHTTPVRLGSRERGVLATDEYLSYAPSTCAAASLTQSSSRLSFCGRTPRWTATPSRSAYTKIHLYISTRSSVRAARARRPRPCSRCR